MAKCFNSLVLQSYKLPSLIYNSTSSFAVVYTLIQAGVENRNPRTISHVEAAGRARGIHAAVVAVGVVSRHASETVT